MDELSRSRSELDPPDTASLQQRARSLLEGDDFQAVRAHLEEHDHRTLQDQRELTEIPAPAFGEAERAGRMAELLGEAGTSRVTTDREGNVLGWLEGSADGAPIMVSAHLDTVFPAGTDVTVRHDGDRLVGPGISDDGRGLAALLALVRAVDATGFRLPAPLLVAATVGEEGAGDLRGVRHLFREGGPGREARAFVSLDGAGMRRVVSVGLGSLRQRLTARGPGGHSWVDWGTPNPIHVLGKVVAAATGLDLPTDPAASLTVARWSGGTSINAIPQSAWIELDMRSEDPDVLESVDRDVRRVAEEAVAEVNRGAPDEADPVELEWTSIGHRPPGRTDPGAALVRAAVAATRVLGEDPQLAVSSTDANIPMSLGVPAITIGAGGEAGLAHTTDEWYRNVRGPDGIVRALLTLVLAGEERG